MEDKTLNEKPPLTKSWSSWYMIVLSFFVFLVVIFFMLTKWFAA